jgi:hypothetical protein
MKLLLVDKRAGHRRWVPFFTLLMLVCSTVSVYAATAETGTPSDLASITNTCTPPGADATVSGTLSCANTTVTLNGASATAGVTFSWSGPQGFASMLQNPVISVPGVYTLTVTSPTGDCTSTDDVTVLQNINLPGAEATVSAILNCSTPSVTLHAETPTAGATFRWIGPGNYISTQQNPSITVPGGYTLNVTNPVNGCTSTATVLVEQSIELPGVSVATPETLTCLATEVQLQASSPLAEAEFTWTGPAGFTAEGDIISVSAPGTYTATATNVENTCKSVRNVTVLQNIAEPGAAASTSGAITCNTTAVTLSASSPAVDVTYQWTGPGNFNSIVQYPVVSRSGAYTLTVTKASNGCISRATANVIQNNAGPGADAAVSGPITCSTSVVTLLGTSPASPVTYRWLGPNNFVSVDQNPTTTRAGGYTLTVTSTATGCTTNDVVVVSQDVTAPAGVTASVSGPLTCSVSSVTLTGTSTTSGVEYSWAGPNGFTSALQNPVVSVAGQYTLTVKRTASACTSTATVNVLQNNTVPVATASVSGTLTCTRTSVTLTVSTTPSPAGLTYAWTGPNGFTSALRNPVVSAPGNYQVIVTDPANTCTSSASITVQEDKAAPGVTASVLSTLTCNVSSVTLVATSGTSGLLFSWTGPAGYSSTEQNAVTTKAGDYTVIATNPVNGCTSTSSVTVNQNTTVPANVVAEGGTLSCRDGSVVLQASSATSGVTYRWTGPDEYVSTAQNPEVDAAGIYDLRVTDPSNGCFVVTGVTVEEDFAAPEGVAASPSTDLSCKESSVTLTGTSLTAGVTYSWTGPQGFTSSSATPVVTVIGTYNLTVTNPANGCFATTSTFVSENRTLPQNVDATVSGPLSCSTSSVTLGGTSSTSDVTYHWTGPNGFVSEEQNPVTSIEGDYTLTVTHPVSGCFVTDAVTVQRNATLPANVDATASATLLNCTTPTITLTGASSTTDVTYQWTGPDNFTSTSSAPVISVPGDYTLTVTHPVSACTATDVITIQRDVTVPAAVTATNSGTLTCATTSVVLSGQTSTSGVTYSWTGPESFTSALQSPSVSVAGTYALIVTHSVSGCTASASTTVLQNTTKPTSAVSNTSGSTTLTCYVSPLLFTGTTTTPGSTLQWTGPNGFLVTTATSPCVASVSVAGDYTFTVIGPNGCPSDARVRMVRSNLVPPTVTATPDGDITCNDGTVVLTGTSTGSNITYSWIGPNGFTSSLQNPEVTVGGDYTLTVSTPGKCTVSSTTTVLEDKIAPQVTADVSGPLSCDMQMVTLLGSSTTSGVTYAWSATNGFTSTEQTPSTTLAGTYTLTVTKSATGCFATDEVTVIDECSTARLATAAPATTELGSEEMNLSIYPNPVKDVASIEFTIPGKGNARLEIYSLLNVKVATLFDGEVQAGTNTVRFDTGNYSSGVYIYRLVYAGGHQEGRLIVTH